MRDLELKEKSEDTHLNWELGIWNAELMDRIEKYESEINLDNPVNPV